MLGGYAPIVSVVRKFRDWIRDEFRKEYGGGYSRCQVPKLKTKIKDFFCKKVFKFSPTFFDENEIIFAALIQSKYAENGYYVGRDEE